MSTKQKQQKQKQQKQQKQRNLSKRNRTKVTPIAAAYSTSTKQLNTPRITSGGSGSIIVNNSEFVAGLTPAATNVFAIKSYAIQPGLAGTFPWLATIANSYDGYKIHKLEFEFKTNVGTATQGHSVQSIDYDAEDDVPSTESELAQSYGAVSNAIWQPTTKLKYDVSKNGFYNKHYTRAGDVPPNSDIKTYDSGNFHFGWQSSSGNMTGTLWVHYTIELYNPQPRTLIGGQVAMTDHMEELSAADPLGHSWANMKANPVSFPFVRSTTDTVTCVAPFEGLVVIRITGTGITSLTLNEYDVTNYHDYPSVSNSTLAVDMCVAKWRVGSSVRVTCSATTVTQFELLTFVTAPLQKVWI